MSKKQDNVRPLYFKDYIGQEDIKSSLEIAINGSKKRGHQLDHILFYGPAGLGKTTISNIIANEIDSNIKIVTGTSIEKAGDIAALLMGLEEGDILFIDEIHRIPKIAEEAIYSAMEDFELHIKIEDGDIINTVVIDLPKFTLIGATTRAGMLTKPLRDRFGMNFRLKYYTKEELSLVLLNASVKLNITLEKDASLYLGDRSRFTPRVGLNLLKRVRDYADQHDSIIDLKLSKIALKFLNIYDLGMEENDIRYLKILTLDKAYGIKTISSKLGEDIQTIEESIEPFLIEQNIIEKTSRGRVLTNIGFNLLSTF